MKSSARVKLYFMWAFISHLSHLKVTALNVVEHNEANGQPT
jgi:hypothetical protein